MSLDVSLIDVGEIYKTEIKLYDANITHNLNTMAEKAGLYRVLWYADDDGFIKAEDMISVLEKGLADLKKRPAYFKKFNPENGWGNYNQLVFFVQAYLDACYKYPKALIRIDR